MGRYPEKTLQLAAIEWLRSQRGYDERISDEEAVGHRMDSVGLLDGRLTLIEVKPAVNQPLVSIIEHKIAGTLGPIYRGDPGLLPETCRSIWDTTTPPLIAVLAASYSTHALAALPPLLDARSSDWLFQYQLWRWNGEHIVVLARGGLNGPIPHEAFATIDIPKLTTTSNRARSRTLPELIEIADQRGVGELFRRFVENARARGHAVQTGRWKVGIKAQVPGYRATKVQFLAAYLDASGLGWLTVGVWVEALDTGGQELPGIAAAKPAGFMNTDRELSTVEEVDALFRIPFAGEVTPVGAAG